MKLNSTRRLCGFALSLTILWHGAIALALQDIRGGTGRDIVGGASAFQAQDIIGGASVAFKNPLRNRDLVGGARSLIVKHVRKPSPTGEVARAGHPTAGRGNRPVSTENNAGHRRPTAETETAETFNIKGN